MSLDEQFDAHLAQAEHLTTLFVAMHDGVSGSSRAPHYVVCALHVFKPMRVLISDWNHLVQSTVRTVSMKPELY